MTNVLCGLVGSKALIYLDDIVIWGTTLEEHNERLIEVFDRLKSSFPPPTTRQM